MVLKWSQQMYIIIIIIMSIIIDNSQLGKADGW